MKTYAHLFKVPINSSYLTPDKVRSVAHSFQKRINDLLEEELLKRDIDFHDYTGPEPALEIILRGR
jgi:hypothetical protein